MRKRDPKWIELQRLLYCMEKQPEPIEGQSWQSLLLRAQLAQDLWHEVASRFNTFHNNNNDYDNNGDYDDYDNNHTNNDRQEFDELAHRVDQACRHAQELANSYQLQLKQQLQQQQQQNNNNNNGMNNADIDDRNNGIPIDSIIESLFFSQEDESNNHKHSSNAGGRMDPEEDDDDDLDETSDSYYDDDEDDEEEDDEDMEEEEEEDDKYASSHHRRRRRRRNDNNTSSNATSSSSPSLEELQQIQREQMEEAISLMARQMKEATQGIHATIQQQTKTTLNELETVAEQNVQDVTQVTQNIQQHNTNRSRSNFGTWTMLFLMIGIFVFCMLTIFTIPKTPNTCFVTCHKTKYIKQGVSIGMSITMSTMKTIYKTSMKAYGKYFHPDDVMMYGLFDDDEDNELDQSTSKTASRINTIEKDEEWKSIYDENELERQQKEELDKLLRDMQQGGTKSKSKTKAPLEGTDSDSDSDIDSTTTTMNNKINKKKSKKKKQDVPDWREALMDDVFKDSDSDDDESDNPWGKKPVKMDDDNNNNKEDDSDNPWGKKPVETKKKKKQQQQTEEQEDDTDNPWGKKPIHVEDKVDPKTNDNPVEDEPVKKKTTKKKSKAATNVNDDKVPNVDGSLADIDEDDIKNRWDSPEGAKKEDYQAYQEHGNTKREELLNSILKENKPEKVEEKTVKDPSEVNMDDLMASLKEHAKRKDDIIAEQHEQARQTQGGGMDYFGTNAPSPTTQPANNAHRPTDEHLNLPDRLNDRGPKKQQQHQTPKAGGGTTSGGGGGESSAFGREGVAEMRTSPRDLRLAAGNGDLDRVKEILQLHPDFANRKDKNGWTALHMSARNGNVAVLQALIDAGGDKDLVTKADQTVYDIAAEHHPRDHAMVKLLRPKLTISKEEIYDDLFLSTHNGDTEQIKEYLDTYPELVNWQDPNGWSTLHIAARAGQLETLKVLMEYGGDKERLTATGHSPYQIAKDHGANPQVLHLLRTREIMDDEIFAALHLAAGMGAMAKVEENLKLRPEFVNRQDQNGWSPVHMAARNGDESILRLLLQFGGQVDLKTKLGKTADQIAAAYHGPDHEIVKFLQRHLHGYNENEENQQQQQQQEAEFQQRQREEELQRQREAEMKRQREEQMKRQREEELQRQREEEIKRIHEEEEFKRKQEEEELKRQLKRQRIAEKHRRDMELRRQAEEKVRLEREQEEQRQRAAEEAAANEQREKEQQQAAEEAAAAAAATAANEQEQKQLTPEEEEELQRQAEEARQEARRKKKEELMRPRLQREAEMRAMEEEAARQRAEAEAEMKREEKERRNQEALQRRLARDKAREAEREKEEHRWAEAEKERRAQAKLMEETREEELRRLEELRRQRHNNNNNNQAEEAEGGGPQNDNEQRDEL